MRLNHYEESVVTSASVNELFDVKLVVEKLYNRVKSVKRISKVNISREDLEYLVLLAMRMNRLPEKADDFDGHNLDKIVFPKCLSWLLVPAKVSLDPFDSSQDLLDRVYFQPQNYEYENYSGKLIEEKYNLERIWNIMYSLYGMFKINTPEVVILDNVRTRVLLHDIVWTCRQNNEFVFHNFSDNGHYWPIPVSSYAVQLYGSKYLNDDAHFDMYEFIAEWRVDSSVR